MNIFVRLCMILQSLEVCIAHILNLYKERVSVYPLLTHENLSKCPLGINFIFIEPTLYISAHVAIVMWY